MDNPSQVYFRVRVVDAEHKPKDRDSHKKLDPSKLLHERMAKILTGTQAVGASIDNRSVHAFLVENGIHNFLQRFPVDYLQQIISMPALHK